MDMAVYAVFEGLPSETQATIRAYTKDVGKLFGSFLEGVLLYGSAVRGDFLHGRSNLNFLLLLGSHDRVKLADYAKAHKKWAREQVVVPLLLTEAELTASVSLFPLEYLEIQEQHRLLAGRDPFIGLHVDTRGLEVQIRQDLRGNLFRLRQRFVEGGGTQEAITILLPLSLTALLPCVRGLQRLAKRKTSGSAEDLLLEWQEASEMDCSGFLDVLHLKRGMISPGPVEIPRLFDRYAAALEALIRFVESSRRASA
jgi:hypothetical protein